MKVVGRIGVGVVVGLGCTRLGKPRIISRYAILSEISYTGWCIDTYFGQIRSFALLANFDVVFKGEGVEIWKI